MNSEALSKLNDKSLAEMRANLAREIAAHKAIVSKLQAKDAELYGEQLDRALGTGYHKKEATK